MQSPFAIYGGIRHYGVDIVPSPSLGRLDTYQVGPSLIYVGARVYRAFKWHFEESSKWEGRNWRRIKRERRKYMRGTD